ncbi:MAG: hypothetical protein V3T83_15795 [Acidobacteriota bacterium]
MASEIPTWYYLFAIILYPIWCNLVYYGLRRRDWEGRKRRLIFRYPLFYTYLFSSILVNFLRFGMANIWGRESYLYTDLYYLSRYLLFVLAIAIIWRIYRLAGRGSGWDYVLLLIFPGFIVFESFRMESSHLYIVISNALLCFEAVLGLLVYLRLFSNRRLRLGANLSGILMGLYIPCLIAWLNHTIYLFGAFLPSDLAFLPSDLSYTIFAYIMEPITLLSWFLIARGMWRLDPPRWEEAPRPDLDGEVTEVFGEAAGALRRMI